MTLALQTQGQERGPPAQGLRATSVTSPLVLSYLRGSGGLERTNQHTNSNISKATESWGKVNSCFFCPQTEEIVGLASKASRGPCKQSPRGCSKQKLVTLLEARFAPTLAAIRLHENNGQNQAPGSRPLRIPLLLLCTCRPPASRPLPSGPPDPSSTLACLHTQMPARAEEDCKPRLRMAPQPAAGTWKSRIS